MAVTNVSATEGALKDGHSDAARDKALCNVERKKMRMKRKKQEKQRKAEEAAITSAAKGPSASATIPKAVRNTTEPARTLTKVNSLASPNRGPSDGSGSKGFVSARAHYSPLSVKFSLKRIDSAGATLNHEDEDVNSSEEMSKQLVTTRSPDPHTTEALQPSRSPHSPIPMYADAPTFSALAGSVSEYDNSVVMIDRPDSESAEEMVARKPHIRNSDDSDDEGSIEETIITHGAQARFSRTMSAQRASPKPHFQAYNPSVDQDVPDDEESTLGDSDPRGLEIEQINHKRHTGFPAAEDLPRWFPKNIKKIYQVDRYGGALSFKELNEITRYRAALERIRRQKWTTYIKAGEARWKLQKILRRLRVRPLTKPFLEYRAKQYQVWKDKALNSWKRLEKTHLGVSILDETININFRQERIIYEKKLGGRL